MELFIIYFCIFVMSFFMAFIADKAFTRVIYALNAIAFGQAAYCNLLLLCNIAPMGSYFCQAKQYTLIVVMLSTTYIWLYNKTKQDKETKQ